MLKNYLKIAFRNLWKNKAFSSINIAGLALGLTCSLFIFLWVQDEYSVDASFKDGARLYTVVTREYADNKIIGGHNTPGLLADELKRVIPEVELATGYAYNHYFTFAAGEKRIKYEGNFAGEDFFKILSYPLLGGSPQTALKSPESISISQKMAIALFGSTEAAMNQTVRFENYKDLRVSAIFADIQGNASEHFDFLINWHFFLERKTWLKDWSSSGGPTFVKLRPSANPKKVDAEIRELIKKYNPQYTPTDRVELGLQRYDEKYLYSNFKDGEISGGRIEYVRLFSLVAIFILLIACINFMNLSTARSLKRAKEIGVRKAIGAIRRSLVFQFMGEALLYTGIAVFISVLLMIILLPAFNQLTGKSIITPYADIRFWLSILSITVFTGLVAGSYPALLLSSFKPIAVLKNTLKMRPSASWFRRGLVIFQFALSIIFISGMLIISKQLNFIQNKNLGYHKNNLIYIPIAGNLKNQFDLFKIEALKIPGIQSISQISKRPVELDDNTSSVFWEGKSPNSKPNFIQASVGYDFIKTMQSEIIKGRDFSTEMADSNNFLVNETALAKIGYQDPIGKRLKFWAIKGTIIGVVRDFHFNSLHVPIEPLVIRLSKGEMDGVALIRVEPAKTSSAIAGLEKLHKNLNPEFPFSHQFADEEYSFLYQSEQVVQKLSGYFAFLAIFISCLGLLGLVMFTAEQRTREIGIRKVLGATTASLYKLLSRDFLILILFAFVIATPLAWWAMNDWLQNFAYREPIHWTVFVIAGMASLVIALLTISFQAVKAANANPVKSLRTE